MRRLVRRPEAVVDLREIWKHVARQNRPAADALVRRIDARLRVLLDHPAAGRPRIDLGPDMRSTPVSRYVIFYRILDTGDIELVRVLHGARDTSGFF